MRQTYNALSYSLWKLTSFAHTLKRTILAVMMLFACAEGALSQTIYYVNSATGSDTNPGTSWSAAFRYLPRAIAAANSSAAPEVDIWVAGGLYTPVDGISSLPPDHRDTSFTFFRVSGQQLKVYGGFRGTETSINSRDTSHPTFLDGIIGSSNSYHIAVIAGLSATADSVVIDGFTIQNGSANGSSSKLFNGVNLEQYNGAGIVLANNGTSKIVIRKCKVTLDNALGIDNECSGWVGGSAYGGGVFESNSPAYFYKCIFYNNSATGNTGGCTTIYSSGHGGDGLGGGLYADSSALSMDSCSFISNSAYGGAGYALAYSSQCGQGGGGGLYVHNCAPAINNSTFTGNSATVGNGGEYGLGGFGGGLALDRSNAVIDNCNFNSNISYPFGGGIYVNNSLPILSYCNFTNNEVTQPGVSNFPYACGGGMFNNNSNSIVNHCNFTGNSANYFSDSTFGAGIYNSSSSPTFNYCNISNNVMPSPYNFWGFGGGVANVYVSQPVFTNCTIDGNSASSGAGVFNEFSSAPIFRNCSISGNTAAWSYSGSVYLEGYGGGVYNNGANPVFINCTLKADTAFFGGAMCNLSSTPQLDSTTFANSLGLNGGGAIYQTNNLLNPVHCVFDSNSAYGYETQGGAIYITGTGAQFTCNGNVFFENNGNAGGGAICLNMPSTSLDTIINSIFYKNYSDNGGAILFNGAVNYVCNNTFYADTCYYSPGGALSLSGPGAYRVANNIFYDNYSNVSLSGYDTADMASGAIYFTNNSFSGSDPLFKDTANPVGPDGVWGTADDGLRLQPCSLGINSGSNAFVVSGEVSDFASDPRILFGVVDKGAYENYIVAPITGGDSVCVGSTISLSDTGISGTWSSSNTAVATVGTTGIVRGVTAGTTTISYFKSYGCIAAAATVVITVQRPASVITGLHFVCTGDTTALIDSAAGGTWTSGNVLVATVDSVGIVSGILNGSATITYTLNNVCGSSVKTFSMTVQRPASVISGTDTLCVGAHTTLTDSASGGAWTSLVSSVASIGTTGQVSALSQGTTSVIYTVTNICGTTADTLSVTVQRPPSIISGAHSICLSGSTTLTDSAINGNWSSSNTAVATVTTGGVVTAVSEGTAIISYWINNVCGSSGQTFIVSIQEAAGPISGSAEICLGGTTALSDAATGGSWHSSSTAIATINAAGVVTGIAQGTAVITYSISDICGTSSATVVATIDRYAAVIQGADSLCSGSAAILTDSTVGGSWFSSAPGVATVSAIGSVNGLSQGTTTISYYVANACGITIARYPVRIEIPASAITGHDTVCQGDTVTLTDVTLAGDWALSDPTIASIVAGQVVGIAPGLVTITYSVSNACGATSETANITVFSTGFCDSLTGVPNVPLQNEITIYPNPASNTVNINAPFPVNAYLLGVDGKTISITKNATQIDLGNIPNGIYFIALYDEQGIKIKEDKIVRISN